MSVIVWIDFFGSFVRHCEPGLVGGAERTLLVGQISPPLVTAVVAQLAGRVETTRLSTGHVCCKIPKSETTSEQTTQASVAMAMFRDVTYRLVDDRGLWVWFVIWKVRGCRFFGGQRVSQ